jgi:hypothetical protein
MPDSVDNFRKSPLFRKLLDDAHNMEEDIRVFNARYRSFLQRDDAIIGVILRCHLVVEHFLDEYLIAAHPGVHGWDSARLTLRRSWRWRTTRGPRSGC